MEPFWDKTYKDKEALSTFGNGQPSSEILDIASRLIKLIKENTRVEGFNIHAVLTDKIALSVDMKPFFIGLFLENEIFSFYEDWKILFKKSYISQDKHGENIRHEHAANKIVAQKVIENKIYENE